MAMRLPSDPKESVPYLRGYYDAKEDYEVKHGRWINGKCSVCGEHALCWLMSSGYCSSPYCPWCGARMNEVE